MKVLFFVFNFILLAAFLFTGVNSFSQEAPTSAPAPTSDSPDKKLESKEDANQEAASNEEDSEGKKKDGEIISFESYLQRLTSIPNIIQRRDPFETQPHPYLKKFSHVEKEKDSGIAPPLQRFPSKNYKVKAVLIGHGTPRALISIPNENKRTWIVKEGALFGNRGGKINAINRKGLRVVEEVINSEGERAKIELELEVTKKEEKRGAK